MSIQQFEKLYSFKNRLQNFLPLKVPFPSGSDRRCGKGFRDWGFRKPILVEYKWWVSAEGMVGYLNTYQLSGHEDYLKKSWNLWQFTRQGLLDHQKGEWFWGVYEDMEVMQADDKIGFWKCPYHNARACMEVLKRLENLN